MEECWKGLLFSFYLDGSLNVKGVHAETLNGVKRLLRSEVLKDPRDSVSCRLPRNLFLLTDELQTIQ